MALLKAGFPEHVPGVQVLEKTCRGVFCQSRLSSLHSQINRMCGSSQQALHFASQAIAAGDMEMAIACGVEVCWFWSRSSLAC
jgi:hypothetical protein